MKQSQTELVINAKGKLLYLQKQYILEKKDIKEQSRKYVEDRLSLYGLGRKDFQGEDLVTNLALFRKTYLFVIAATDYRYNFSDDDIRLIDEFSQFSKDYDSSAVILEKSYKTLITKLKHQLDFAEWEGLDIRALNDRSYEVISKVCYNRLPTEEKMVADGETLLRLQSLAPSTFEVYFKHKDKKIFFEVDQELKILASYKKSDGRLILHRQIPFSSDFLRVLFYEETKKDNRPKFR